MKRIHLEFASLWHDNAPKARSARNRREYDRLMWLELLLWAGAR